MNCPALDTIQALLNLSWNVADRHEETIKTYAEVGNHLLMRYNTGAVISNADEDIHKFGEVSLTL